MPIVVEDACYVNTLCEKINYMSLDGASQELAASDSHLALMKPYPVERDSRQQREMLTDLTDQSRKDGQNTILDNGFQIVPLESVGCELQIGKKNPHDLNDLSIRKLRALLKEKNMPRNNGRKERERVVLRDLTSIELEERKKVSDNTRL
uniref:SAP domain-containing protein n=1 Tax=Picea sitchensis TaxID=3332 RepID=D5A8I8_PICSI|nr:unknown [Picea sitchensis]